ncbi:TniB family NTP-binding protein [Streptomyces lavendulae]|uniref:TniB family NTP-binding protein n=1 Tax=Streptomyces lavendulae TaxID=1914 RepID=UPI003F4D20B7
MPAPSQATLYRLVHQLAHPTDLPGRPMRNPPITSDGRGFTPTVALRPGEQVQIDTTRLDVLAVFDDGCVGRPELTIAVDVATRAILAAVLCPSSTQAVDAALLRAEIAVPHPARPTWPDALRFAHRSLLPHQRLLSLDGAAARPAVVPETIVTDRGSVYLSKAFTAACETLGISVQAAPPYAPTAPGKPSDVQVHVAYVLVPPGATAKTLAAEFARYLGMPVTARMTRTQITESVCHTYNQARVRLVLIDEIHRVNPRTTTGAEALTSSKTSPNASRAHSCTPGSTSRRRPCSPVSAVPSCPAGRHSSSADPSPHASATDTPSPTPSPTSKRPRPPPPPARHPPPPRGLPPPTHRRPHRKPHPTYPTSRHHRHP